MGNPPEDLNSSKGSKLGIFDNPNRQGSLGMFNSDIFNFIPKQEAKVNHQDTISNFLALGANFV